MEKIKEIIEYLQKCIAKSVSDNDKNDFVMITVSDAKQILTALEGRKRKMITEEQKIRLVNLLTSNYTMDELQELISLLRLDGLDITIKTEPVEGPSEEEIHIKLSEVVIDNDNLDYIKVVGEICGKLRYDLVKTFAGAKWCKNWKGGKK